MDTVLQLFTTDFPHTDIHEMILPNLLHQVIKGAFKDHLVMWVGDYLALTWGKCQANKILDDIDRQYITNFLFILASSSHTGTKEELLPYHCF